MEVFKVPKIDSTSSITDLDLQRKARASKNRVSNKSKQDFKRITHLSATRIVPIGTFSVKEIEQPVYESLANLEKKIDEYYKDKMA